MPRSVCDSRVSLIPGCGEEGGVRRRWSSAQKFLELSLGEVALHWRAFLHQGTGPTFRPGNRAALHSLAQTVWGTKLYLFIYADYTDLWVSSRSPLFPPHSSSLNSRPIISKPQFARRTLFSHTCAGRNTSLHPTAARTRIPTAEMTQFQRNTVDRLDRPSAYFHGRVRTRPGSRITHRQGPLT